MNDSPPDDIDWQQEREIYQLFGELRKELHTIVVDLADVVMLRIDRTAQTQDRLKPPGIGEILSSGFFDIVNVISSWADRDDKKDD